MKVLVTGCGGFIGTNLTRELLTRGCDVIGIDNFSTGCQEYVTRNLDIGPGKFEFYKKDINDADLYNIMNGVDKVFHLAALARVAYSIDYPIEANHANINGMLNILEASRKAGVKRVIFSSSSSIYGGVAEFPTKESAILSPKSPYALHKMVGEEYCKLYSSLHGLDTVNLRYFNVVGPHQRVGAQVAYSTVIPAFMNIAVNGGTCIIHGTGDVERDFCPVENVVAANILAAEHNSWLGGEAFNVACGETHSIQEVYEKICKLSGKTIPVTYGPPRLGDPKKSLADISKITKVLGYNIVSTFDETMEKTYNWWLTGCKI